MDNTTEQWINEKIVYDGEADGQRDGIMDKPREHDG